MKEITRDYREIESPIIVLWKQDDKNSCSGVFRYPKFLIIWLFSQGIFIFTYAMEAIIVSKLSFVFVSQFSEGMSCPFGISFGMNEIYFTQSVSNCLNVYSIQGKIS